VLLLQIAFFVVATALNLALLFAGIKKITFSTRAKMAIAVSELSLTVVSLVLLGLWGIPLAVGILLVSALVFGVKSAVEFEAVCASCSIYGQFHSKEQAATFIRDLRRRHKSLEWLGLMGLARVVLRLSERHRSPDEISHMAAPIAMLATVNGTDPLYLADKIDRILRRWDKPASDAMGVADIVTASAQRSSATFDEMLDGLSSF
jgi:hypothetical protein